MSNSLTPDIIRNIVKLIPDTWLVGDSPFSDSNEHRNGSIPVLQ
ncbi:hypothetical protein [Microcoleus sp. Pol10D4]